jgi:hypothetical protein
MKIENENFGVCEECNVMLQEEWNWNGPMIRKLKK